MNRLLIALFLCSGIALGQTTVPFVIVPAVPSNPNLITNGSFSTDASSWTGVGATVSSTTGGYSGKCLYVVNTGTSYGRAEQDLTLSAGSTYTLTAYCKNGDHQCEILVLDNSYNTLYDTGYINNASWGTQTSFTFTATATVRIQLVVGHNVSGNYVYYDEISVTKN